MRRFRVNFLTGLIACGLLCLNLGGLVFSYTAELPAASAAAIPVDSDDTDDAGLTDLACVPSIRHEATAVQSVPAHPTSLAARYSFPPLVPGHVSWTWHLMQRAAATPRAPAFLA